MTTQNAQKSKVSEILNRPHSIVLTMTSAMDMQIILTEQNVTANWVRNGLIATLVALAIFGLITLDRVQNQNRYVSYLKILGVAFILIAMWMFWSFSSVSQNFHNTFNSSEFSFLINNSRNVSLALMLVLVFLAMVFIFV